MAHLMRVSVRARVRCRPAAAACKALLDGLSRPALALPSCSPAPFPAHPPRPYAARPAAADSDPGLSTDDKTGQATCDFVEAGYYWNATAGADGDGAAAECPNDTFSAAVRNKTAAAAGCANWCGALPLCCYVACVCVSGRAAPIKFYPPPLFIPFNLTLSLAPRARTCCRPSPPPQAPRRSSQTATPARRRACGCPPAGILSTAPPRPRAAPTRTPTARASLGPPAPTTAPRATPGSRRTTRRSRRRAAGSSRGTSTATPPARRRRASRTSTRAGRAT